MSLSQKRIKKEKVDSERDEDGCAPIESDSDEGNILCDFFRINLKVPFSDVTAVPNSPQLYCSLLRQINQSFLLVSMLIIVSLFVNS